MQALKSPRRLKQQRDAAPTQLGLFDCPPPKAVEREARPKGRAPPVDQTRPPLSIASRGEERGGCPVVTFRLGSTAAPRRPAPRPTPEPRLITKRDVPAYPEEEVERAIAEIRTDRVLLGYKDIKDFIGVCKATANRRMKDGLVPGVRLLNGNVIRDGGVRRLDREQVKWLLLSLRRGQSVRGPSGTGR